MRKTHFFALSALFFVLLYSPFLSSLKISDKRNKTWTQSLRKKMEDLDALYPGQIGIYVKEMEDGDEFSFQAEDTWYIASGVKLPIALETLRQIDEKKYTLDSEIELTENDYIDGAGETNQHKPGAKLKIRYLIEQMLIYSDNTASDLLIHRIGLSSVNQLMQKLIASGFSPITTLADVRRHVYSLFHPSAFNLKGRDFLLLKSARKEKDRIRKLRALLKLKRTELKSLSLEQAFSHYYSQKLNSATLQSYGLLLEKVLRDQTLLPMTKNFLLETMSRVETGKKRIRAGFPPSYRFAHKTGTQHSRVCDFGIAWPSQDQKQRPVVIAACSRGFQNINEAERALKQVGQAIYESGVFESRKTGVVATGP